MADRVTLKIEGLSTVEAALRELPQIVQTQILADALLAGGNVLRDGIRGRIHNRTGRTAADVQTVVEVPPNELAGVAIVGGTRDKKTGRSHILRFLERGTKPHVEPRKRKGPRISITLGSRTVTRRGLAPQAKRIAFQGKVYNRVQHPGTHAQAPMRITIAEQGIPAVRAFSQKAWNGIRAAVDRLRQSGGGP
jgi:hypothetical protein